MDTPDYMAPEQRSGTGHPDHRADIFALGVMLYEMLTGQRPHGTFQPPSHRVQVDVRIDEVVLKALQQEPDRRYQQASEMKVDVDRIRTTPEPSAETKPPAQSSTGVPSVSSTHGQAAHTTANPAQASSSAILGTTRGMNRTMLILVSCPGSP